MWWLINVYGFFAGRIDMIRSWWHRHFGQNANGSGGRRG